jgi:apolipoprotein N-acyltransferase
LRPLLLAVASGILATLSLPSYSFSWLAWIALAPLLYGLREGGPGKGALGGLLFGMTFGATSFFWVLVIPTLNGLHFAMMVLVFGLFYLAFGALYALAVRRVGAAIILVGPALWVACEYARGNFFFLAYPWNFLAHSQYANLAVIQVADFSGAYGVSFLLALVGQLASEVPDVIAGRALRWRMQALVAAALVAASLGYGWRQLSVEPATAGRLRVALVQANIMAHNYMPVAEQMRHLASYERLTRLAAAERPQLIVWPSSSLPGPISFWMIRMMVADVAFRAGVPLLVGGAGGDKFAPARDGLRPYSNSEFLLAPTGVVENQYNKVRLTPFNEEVPLQGLVTWPRWLTGIEKGFVPGEGFTVFSVGEARFGTPICWENAFPDVFRRFVADGANFMVSVTNEGVFGATSGPRQTLAMNVFRAVENRVAVARAATTGVSAFIDPKGKIVARVKDGEGNDLFVPGFAVWDMPLASEKTFYTRHGDVFAVSAAVLALLAIALAGLRR